LSAEFGSSLSLECRNANRRVLGDIVALYLLFTDRYSANRQPPQIHPMSSSDALLRIPAAIGCLP
jgi:hypothetical protein